MTRNAFWLPLLAVVLVGCGGEYFEYRSLDSSDPQGPGLFSGEAGAFVLFSDKKKAGPSKELSGENEEFEEFQRWKRSDKNTEEYREFQEWRAWKAYKKWKDGQPKELTQ
jgi:hypothetical protein